MKFCNHSKNDIKSIIYISMFLILVSSTYIQDNERNKFAKAIILQDVSTLPFTFNAFRKKKGKTREKEGKGGKKGDEISMRQEADAKARRSFDSRRYH